MAPPLNKFDELQVRAHEAYYYRTDVFGYTGLLFAIHDPQPQPDWIAWYGFVQNDLDYDNKEIKGLSYYTLVGTGTLLGYNGVYFRPFKPLQVNEFATLNTSAAAAKLTGALSFVSWVYRGQEHRVGLTVFLDKPQNFTFTLISVKPPVNVPKRFLRGYVTLLTVQEWSKKNIQAARDLFLKSSMRVPPGTHLVKY